MTDATISFVVVLFVSNRIAVEVVAIGAALTLYFSGVLTLGRQTLGGFGDPAVVVIAALFVPSFWRF